MTQPVVATSTSEPKRVGLDTLLAPRSVAVVGASATPGKLGYSVLRNLVRGGFAGEVFAVNSGGVSVVGQPGFRSVSDIGAKIDCAFLAIPAGAIEQAVADCAKAGVGSVVVGASGFAELGTLEGARRQSAIGRIARDAGMRVLGPNTNGFLNVPARVSLGYNASHAEAFPAGHVSIVSHSGALFDGIAKRLRSFGAGIAKFVAVGNEADISMLDLLDHLADDPDTHVVGLVIEGLSDGARLRRAALRLAHAGKRVVVLKIGRSREGAGAALAHSSRLAGSSRAWDALLEACGFSSVHTVEALAGACALLASTPVHGEDQRVLCVTTSGAGGAILADFASDRGLPLAPQWDGETAATIARLPTSAAIRNPVDMGSLGDWGLLDPVLKAAEAGGLRGPVAVYGHVAPAPGMADQMAAALIARRQRCSAPIVVLAPGGLGDEIEKRYMEAGIPVFHDSATCFDALACTPPSRTPEVPTDVVGDERRPNEPLLATRGVTLSELDSSGVLGRAGIPMVPSRVIRTEDEASRAARDVGYPVVLKALAPGIAHKHAAGLVAVDLGDDAAVRSAFNRQTARVASLDAASGTTWLVQPMLRGRLELLLGTSLEPGLGHFLVFGLGGVQAEVFDQVRLIAVPSSEDRIREVVAGSRIGALLRSIDATGSALTQAVDALVALQRLVLAEGERIRSIDVNPLLVTGAGCVAVDGLIVTQDELAG